MSDLKVGDRVRVVIEGRITEPRDADDEYRVSVEGQPSGLWFDPMAKGVVSVEKLAPPVVTFEPGDIVQRKSDGNRYLILQGSKFTYLFDGGVGNRRGSVGTTSPSFRFTSANYDKIEVPA